MVILLGTHAALYLNSDLSWSELAWLLWHALGITSVAVIRHAPGISLGLAVLLAVYDLQFFDLLAVPAPMMVAVVAVYPAVNAAHATYLRLAWDRQRRYAHNSAQTPVEFSPVAPARLCPRVRDVLGHTFGWWTGAMIFLLLPMAAGALEDTHDDRWETAEAFGVVALLLLVPIALVSWRDQRRETMAIAWLSSGPHHGLPIVMVVTPDGNVRLRVRGEPEPFAAFTARKGPNNEPPTVPLDTPIAGILFGDLRSRGWAAAATGGILILPQEPLATDSDALSDVPSSDS